MLNDLELKHYHRQIMVPQVGMDGQKTLKQSSVLIVGMGGLGCAVAPYLCAAGIGRLGLMDFDHVARSNLARQILYQVEDIGENKAIVAQKKLQALNPHTKSIAYPYAFQQDCEELLQSFDLVIDATDHFATRALISQLCVHTQKPCVYAAVSADTGHCALFVPEQACYRCVFPHIPPAGVVQNCAQNGVLGPAVGLLGTMQALKAIHYLCQFPQDPILHCIDLHTLSMYNLPLTKNPQCPQCAAPLARNTHNTQSNSNTHDNSNAHSDSNIQSNSNAHNHAHTENELSTIKQSKSLNQRLYPCTVQQLYQIQMNWNHLTQHKIKQEKTADTKTDHAHLYSDYPILIDVRETSEFQAQHIQHAVHMPWSLWQQSTPCEILQKINDLVQKQTQSPHRSCSIILYCQQGIRSEKAWQWIQHDFEHEFTTAHQQYVAWSFYHLHGGMSAWLEWLQEQS